MKIKSHQINIELENSKFMLDNLINNRLTLIKISDHVYESLSSMEDSFEGLIGKNSLIKYKMLLCQYNNIEDIIKIIEDQIALSKIEIKDIKEELNSTN